MKQFAIVTFIIIFHFLPGFLFGQNKVLPDARFEVSTLDNHIFVADKFWRGADGAAIIDLENGKILWLFSDSFIDTHGKGQRVGSKMINNTIAINLPGGPGIFINIIAQNNHF